MKWFFCGIVLGLVGCASGPRTHLNTAALYPTLEPFSSCRLEDGADYEPTRGHVVVVTLDGARTVRRVVGLAGDRVRVRDGLLEVGGQSVAKRETHARVICLAGVSSRCRCRVSEEEVGARTYPVQRLLPPETETDARCMPGPDSEEVVVPEGHVFLLADNRAGAEDSRTLGPLPLARIEARVISCLPAQRPGEEAGPLDLKAIERELKAPASRRARPVPTSTPHTTGPGSAR